MTPLVSLVSSQGDNLEPETIAIASWLDPKIVIPACVVLASVIVPLLLHYLKGKRERAQKILEIRTKAYTEYFRKYEEAAKGVGNDYEEFSKITLKNEFKKLLESGNTPDAIIEFQEAVGKFPHQIQDSHRKATEEISTLKILGSSGLLEVTTEFEQLNQEILELSSEGPGGRPLKGRSREKTPLHAKKCRFSLAVNVCDPATSSLRSVCSRCFFWFGSSSALLTCTSHPSGLRRLLFDIKA